MKKILWLAILIHPLNDAFANDIEIPESDGNDFYSSVGKLHGDLTCSVSFVQFGDDLDSKALFLSNGHCAQDAFDYSSSNDIILNSPVDYTAEFNYFIDTVNSEEIVEVEINKVLYSTMKGNDISILSSNETVAQLLEKGLRPYRVSNDILLKNTDITIAGVPINIDALQLSYCSSEERYDIVENNWHWYGFSENSCKGISPGSSGSPAFDVSGNIVGLINTTTNTAVGQTCYNGNPCAVNELGANLREDKNYLIPLDYLEQCFSQDGQFSIENVDCDLPKPNYIDINNYPYIFSGENAYTKSWDFTFSNNGRKVRYKVIHLSDDTQSCSDITDYSLAMNADEIEPSEIPIDTSLEGVHQFCIIDEEDEEANKPNIVQILVDNTAPTEQPELSITPWSFEPIFNVPEYSDYWLAWGDPEIIDCEEEKYIQYTRIPIPIENTPLKVCLYGFDLAGNKSEKFEYIISDSN
jgi:hypothetical protein